MSARRKSVAMAIVLLARFASGDDWDSLHSSVCGIGNLDGDGTPDFVLASRDAGAAETVWAFSGRTGKFLWGLQTDRSGDGFGASLACAGDVNGDGIDDVLIGAPGRRLVESQRTMVRARVGRAYLVSGKDGTILRVFAARADEETLGVSVAGSDDLDSDGVPDLLVGCPGTLGVGARAYSGRTGQVLRQFGANEKRSSTELGVAVCDIGDFDGDHCPDVAVGDTGARRSAHDGPNDMAGAAGCVRVFSGRTGETLKTVWSPRDNRNGDPFGWVVERVADFDRDGIRDVSMVAVDGVVRVLSAKTLEDIVAIPWKGGVLVSFGSSVASIGYERADRSPELVIAANESASDFFDRGFVQRIPIKDTTERTSVYEADANGVDVACPGDLDGDGEWDLVLSIVGPRGFGRGGCEGQQLMARSSHALKPLFTRYGDELRRLPVSIIAVHSDPAGIPRATPAGK